jgi:hypothetical protein
MAIVNTITSVTSIIRGLIQDPLRTDGRIAYTYKTSNVFTLPDPYLSSATIVVFHNGAELVLNTDYTYNSDNNQITITASLTANDSIVVTYSYYKKYSDNEIEGYLASSFVYFVQYKYKKTFLLNDDDEIVAENDYDPSTDELYFIAIIASILIDPQNIKISIPDLAIDAKRDKSDQEQIKDAFNNFQSYLGSIDFTKYIN